MLDVKNMTKSDFWYDLPKELIAQHPIEPRNASRMMKIDRKTGECVHSHFYDLCDFFAGGRSVGAERFACTACPYLR